MAPNSDSRDEGRVIQPGGKLYSAANEEGVEAYARFEHQAQTPVSEFVADEVCVGDHAITELQSRGLAKMVP